jgi:carbonic anhydrase
MYTD